MHACALELNKITRGLEVAKFNKNQIEINNLRKRYEDILSEHENHSDIDFVDAKIRKAHDFYNINIIDKICIYFRKKLELLPYFILIFLPVAFLIISVCKPIFDIFSKFPELITNI